MASLRSYVLAAALVGACGGDHEPGNTVAFDLESPLAGETYWNLPFPSDLRLTPDGRPDLGGFPNPRDLPIVNDLLAVARDRAGFPVMPIAWFRFTQAAPEHALADVITGDEAAAILIDVDPASPHRGRRYPIVAQTLAVDLFTGENLVAVAPRPGIVLEGHTMYAYALRTTFAPGAERAPAFAELAAGRTPAGARGAAAATLYAPLFETLDTAGIARDEIIVATVFTTGDEVGVLRARSEAIRAAATATIANLKVDPVDGAAHDGFCELVGEVTVPTYQVGAPPFDSEGKFVLDDTGTPIPQGETTIPVRITLPAQTMPAGGWPLWQFFHGSGGISADLVDDGPSATADSIPEIGKGPGFVVAQRGIAAVSSALPANPERLPGASNYAYLNLNNLSAFPYTFQQGAFEQRLLLDALLALEIPQATVAACSGLALPSGATSHRFDATKLMAGGHSMGGMYTNMIAAVEPRYGAVTPFGAGGLWNMMILDTAIVTGARDLLGGVLGVDPAELSFVHPSLALIGLGWEIAEPITSMARLARSPLAGMPARHIYQPIGKDDQFFPNPVFDAAALAYGNREAGDVVWPETQAALGVDALDGLAPYPVRGNRDGTTAVVVQYLDGGILDAHYIHRQLDAVKYQYGCFLATYLRDGTPTVFAPAALTAACP
ncbi:MAG: hypothetical protein ABI867_05720 [Kofleriaceae bacterium]